VLEDVEFKDGNECKEAIAIYLKCVAELEQKISRLEKFHTNLKKARLGLSFKHY